MQVLSRKGAVGNFLEVDLCERSSREGSCADVALNVGQGVGVNVERQVARLKFRKVRGSTSPRPPSDAMYSRPCQIRMPSGFGALSPLNRAPAVAPDK